jgi:hypothetical protein
MSRNIDMIYDLIQERWVVELNGRHCGLHCGEVFELNLQRQTMPCRLEMDDEWYIILKGARMNLRTHETYKINI